MQHSTIQKLNSLNKVFYSKQAESFSETRQVKWSGWGRIATRIAMSDNINQDPKILDLGCGNGRFIKELYNDRVVDHGKYVGVDASLKLLEIADKNLTDLKDISINLHHMDLLGNPDLVGNIGLGFNVIAMFGLMHHIPGYENRLNLIDRALKLLTKDGLLAVSLWQFMKASRLAKKRLSDTKVQEILKDAYQDLETGDYLLDWDNSGLPRYCHNFSDEELDKLQKDIVDLGYSIIDSYSSDGKEGNLNRYLIITH